MKLTVCVLATMCLWHCAAQESEPDLLRISRKNPSSYPSPPVNGYRANVNTNLKHSISTVTVQLHLKDKARSDTASDEDVETPSAHEDYHSKPKTHIENKNKKIYSQSIDSEEGASNEGSQARYVYPPEGFLDNLRQNNNNNNNNVHYASDSHSTYGSTPTPKASYNSSPKTAPSGSEQPSSSNVQYVASPAPPHFSATQTPRVQYVSNPSNYQDASISQLNYISTPDPSNSYNSNSFRVSNFGSQQQPQSYSNHIQYVSTPSPRSSALQGQFSTPAPSVQFAAQISQNHPASSNHNYVSSPAPNAVYLSTPQSRGQYVSSPVQYVSTPSPVQYTSSSSSYGTHLSSNRDQGLYQMQIDHFNNAMSGVRNPKYAPQISESVFMSSTPEPVVISTAVSSKQHQNEQKWKTGIIPNALFKEQPVNYNFNGNHNQQPHQPQQYAHFATSNQKQSQQYQSEKDTQSPNSLVFVNPFQQSHEKNSHKTFQRDVDTETEVAQLYSNGDFGWKVSPKKTSSQNNIGEYTEQRQVIYSPSPVPNNYPTQTSSPHSESSLEYRPYPNNPFLNHIAIQKSPQVNSGAVQSINFQPDHNQQQNINVGYSIGFGNQLASNQETPKVTKNINDQGERDLSDYQPFTTASSRPTVQSDIIKGVKVSQVNSPDQSYFLRDTQNRYENPQNNRESFESTGNQIHYFERALNEYQKTPQFKEDNSRNNEEKVQTQFFGNSAKLINLDSPKFSENFNRNDGKTESYKWSNFGAGVEVSTLSSPSSPIPSIQLTPEMTSNYPVVYVNNPNNVVTNAPFYFSTPKDVNNARYFQTFDHEKAIKNIQPIDLSNVVPHTSSPLSNNERSFPTPYSNYPQQVQQQSYSMHQNSVQQVPGQQVLNYQQEQYQISPSPLNYQNPFYQESPSNLYSNSKAVEQAYYKDKEVIFSTQQPQPTSFDNSRNELRSYIFGNPNEQTSFESSNYNQNTRLQSVPQNLIGAHSSDMIAYASNVQPRQTTHIDYVPSETFRLAPHESNPTNQRQSNQETENKPHQAQSTGQIKYTHVSHSPNSEFQKSNEVFTNPGFEKEYNKNNVRSKSIPERSESDKYQSMSSNNRQLRQNKGESTYDNMNDIFPNGPPSKLTTINGLKVANPYNMDLQVVSDILSGKIAVDETLLHTVREQVARLNPIKLNTKELQDQTSKNEEISVQIDLPSHEVHDNKDIKEQSSFKSDRSSESANKKVEEKKFKNRLEELVYTQSSRPFASFYERNDHELQYPISSSIVSEHLSNSGESILNQHEIGSVIDQQVYPSEKARNNGGLTIPEIEDFGTFDSYKTTGLEKKPKYYQRPNLLPSDEILQNRAKPEREPYTLLVPPRPPGSMRGVIHRKSEQHPIRLRTHKLSQRRSRPSKQVLIFDETAEDDNFEHIFNIKTELRPPPKRL